MSKPARLDTYYKILTATGGDEATIMLYGYIGEEYRWDGERYEMTGVTDIEFVKELDRLADQYPLIHIRINSPGGDLFHGNAIQTAIRNCKAEVHTWVDGLAASMAADIWLCGHRRHMARNALVMIHPVWNICIGHAQEMRECADTLDKMTEAVIIATAASTGISEDEIRSRYYADYKDHWLSYADAEKDGLLTDLDDDYNAEPNPEKLASMSYKQLVDHFQKTQHPEAPGLLARIGDMFKSAVMRRGAAKSIVTPIQNNPDMNLEEFKKSLADGTLNAAEVQTLLTELNPPAAPAQAGDEDDDAPMKIVLTKLDAMQKEITAQKAQIDALSAAPGAARTQPAAPAADLPTDGRVNALEEFNKSLAASAEEGMVRFVPGTRS